MNGSSNDPSASNKLYNVLKFIALILLPGLGTLYFALAGVWHLPAANEVVATITSVDTFLGLIVQFMANKYNKSDARYDGAIVVRENTSGAKVYSLEVGNLDNLDTKSQVVFRIKGSSG